MEVYEVTYYESREVGLQIRILNCQKLPKVLKGFADKSIVRLVEWLKILKLCTRIVYAYTIRVHHSTRLTIDLSDKTFVHLVGDTGDSKQVQQLQKLTAYVSHKVHTTLCSTTTDGNAASERVETTEL